MSVIIPPTGNETISMLKNKSLVSVIAVPDLLFAARGIYSVNYETIPLLIVGQPLVPGSDHRALDRPVLPRAPLRSRYDTRAGPDPVPADPQGIGARHADITGRNRPDEPPEIRTEHRG